MKTIYSFALVILLWIPAVAQKKQLALNLAKDATYNQLMTSNTTIVQSIQEQEIKINMTITGKTNYKVKGFANSVYDLEVQYESLTMKMVMPTGTMEFSSEKKEASDDFSKILSMMRNKPFQVLMYNNGKVKEVKNSEAIFVNVFEQFPALGDAQKAQLKSQLTMAYGDKALKGNIEMATAIFADFPVAKGDTWVVKTQLESGMSTKIESTYQLTDVADPFYTIHGTAKMETADKDAYIESNGMPIRYELTGTMTSDIKVDKKTGWISEAKVNQKLEGTAFIKDNPTIPGGMTVPMKMNNDMVVTDK